VLKLNPVLHGQDMEAMRKHLCFLMAQRRGAIVHEKIAAQDTALLLRLPQDDVVLEANRRGGRVLCV